jgi:hypothetical protein
MNTLRKKLLTAAAIAGLGLTTIAFAGPWGGDCPMGHGKMRGGDGSQRMEMMQQHHAERMELLEARLKLKPEQQTTWKGFLTAQTAHHAAMLKIREEMRDQETTALAHFEERVQGMEQRLTSMKTVLKAGTDLYAALDPEQKKVMDKFFTDRPMHRMMRGMMGAGPEQPAQ